MEKIITDFKKYNTGSYSFRLRKDIETKEEDKQFRKELREHTLKSK